MDIAVHVNTAASKLLPDVFCHWGWRLFYRPLYAGHIHMVKTFSGMSPESTLGREGVSVYHLPSWSSACKHLLVDIRSSQEGLYYEITLLTLMIQATPLVGVFIDGDGAKFHESL